MGDKKVEFRLLFVTDENPFYVRLFFEEFFRIYQPLRDVRGVVVAKAMGKKNKISLIKK